MLISCPLYVSCQLFFCNLQPHGASCKQEMGILHIINSRQLSRNTAFFKKAFISFCAAVPFPLGNSGCCCGCLRNYEKRRFFLFFYLILLLYSNILYKKLRIRNKFSEVSSEVSESQSNDEIPK